MFRNPLCSGRRFKPDPLRSRSPWASSRLELHLWSQPYHCYTCQVGSTTKNSAVGYLRVSSSVQVEGTGLDVQRASIEATATRMGLVILAWCEDAGVSGTVEALDRPGFNCLVEHLASGEAAYVLAHHADRLARTLHVQEAALAVLWQHGATVVLGGEVVQADDPSDPMRTLIRQILGAVAEYSRRDVVVKMHSGRKAVRRREPDRYIGGATIPAGCSVVDGRLVATRQLIDELAAIRAGIGSGLSLSAVGRRLRLQSVQVQRRLATAERLGL